MQLADLTGILLSLVVLLIPSLTIHEAAHALAADRLGDPTPRMLGRLTLNPLAHIDWIGTVLFPVLAYYSPLPLLGWAKPVPVNLRNLRHPRRDFALVALAGPVSNVCLAIIGALVARTLASFRGDSISYLDLRYVSLTDATPVDWAIRFVMLNVSLAVFNMIPVPPLDGGNVLAGLGSEAVARLVDAIRPYGFIVLYGLMFTGVLYTLLGPVTETIVVRLLL